MLEKQNIETVLKWAKFIENDPGVRELCDRLGRMMRAERRKIRKRVRSVFEYNTTVPDADSREEITGITFGRAIEDVLPCELATMASQDMELLFDQKYVENRLMSFEKTDFAATRQTTERQTTRSATVEDNRGPVILCIDTSGSMAGVPETVAKAVALFIAMKAHKEGRNCYMITFSTGIEVFDFSVRNDLAGLFAFLQMWFHGGTDFAPALAKGVDMMSEPEYAKADLLLISDFVAGALDNTTAAAIAGRKKAGNRFHALSVEPNASALRRYASSGVFDEYLRYDGRSVEKLSFAPQAVQ